MNSAPFLIFGGILAWLFVYFLRLRRFYAGEFLLGLFIFGIAITIQSIIQKASLVWFNVHAKLLISLWLGFLAGFIQEGIKYIFVKGMTPYKGAMVGLGFGIAEVILLAVVATLAGSSNVPLYLLVASATERFFAVVFHVASTSLLASSNLRIFLGVFTVHGLVDTLASYSQLSRVLNTPKVFLIEAVFGVFALFLLLISLPRIRVEKEEGPKW
ncbi:hypothetical protein [Pyrococcus horikoshii]|uniref:YhfC family intramembrane metalloprotease n=2 Tax=Pyrococcus horikoshii TaxID=53953 RepID=O59320_PYRHO|nr:hypothetical protein [Pyrococcus horikoshii]BAA30793.1 213aa long hypothetical protein [Pyrococcus horikoshii OT3]HII60648.1 hypothetical protein [Pyrococcus horikoshii]